jgi:hypothetical protein
MKFITSTVALLPFIASATAHPNSDFYYNRRGLQARNAYADAAFENELNYLRRRDLYEREAADLYERDIAELYERDIDGLYERDIDGFYERDIDSLYARDFDSLYLTPRELKERSIASLIAGAAAGQMMGNHPIIGGAIGAMIPEAFNKFKGMFNKPSNSGGSSPSPGGSSPSPGGSSPGSSPSPGGSSPNPSEVGGSTGSAGPERRNAYPEADPDAYAEFEGYEY